jgi:5'-3' exonuclease
MTGRLGAMSPTSTATDDEPRLLLVLDAPSLLHRNHHARVGSDLRDLGGRPAWALHGMLRQILEAIDRFAPALTVFGFDDRTSSVRTTAYPDYKAGRAEKQPELVEQLDRAPAMLEAIGLHTVTPDGLEADDVSASAAVWSEREGWHCVIVTSDRDSFAHLSETTRVLRLIDGGIHGSPTLDPKRLRTMYDVDAEHYLDYAALRGDASDNLPGVSGIGKKTAATILSEMGSMREVWADIEHAGGANLVAALDSLAAESGGRRIGNQVLKKLTAAGARDQFDFNRTMMTSREDVDLGLIGAAGRLPLAPDAVARVVDHLGVAETTELALRVLTAP